MAISITQFNNETWFKIANHDQMRPFFMNVVSDSNHWMFISSNGGLTCGRKNPAYSLFPYYTEDKLFDLGDTTGSKSIFQVHINGVVSVWEPFSDRFSDRYTITRNLYKNYFGNKILFEEINQDLGLIFRYQWNSSHVYGFVKKSEIINTSANACTITLLDGIHNILPYGVDTDLQTSASNLVDAYKRSELVAETGLGIFALSACIVDKAEPSEALKANTVWSLGLEKPSYLLSSVQLSRFRMQQPVQEEHDVKGEKGAYFVLADVVLPARAAREWKLIANVNQNHAQIIECNLSIKAQDDLDRLIQEDIDTGTRNLVQLIAGADGLQFTADHLKDTRHYSNVLFNIMRGGTFDRNYHIEKNDFVPYLKNANSGVFQRNTSFIDALNTVFDKSELYGNLEATRDPDLIRLSKEYLPLKFSRRHGDPSRPWNQFSINTHNELDGSKILDYEGNWRDIFQNWEALVHSYPDFAEGMIFKFLNATTFDGYNPYRVTKGGFDWETIEPDNPWSYIGYWGDHQIIYLLKFLEFSQTHNPEMLSSLFNAGYFTYANVPYRIKSYEQIANDPKNTIDFDFEADLAIREKIEQTGADGALLGSRLHTIHHVGFLEKILATVLAKMSNFIPEGGIWMNTQRPEWNDANNALVGNGVSMVTLYYLRRFLKFFEKMVAASAVDHADISEELTGFFTKLTGILEQNRHLLRGTISDLDRKSITDALGKAGSDYRNLIYKNGFSGKKTPLPLNKVAGFCDAALAFLEQSIRANRRSDNLYHAYNLMSMNKDGISISHLSEMLEGQVAVISSGYLNAGEVAGVLDALRNSSLYREDQNSYILYPNKELPRFLEKNTIPTEQAESSQLFKTLVENQVLTIVNRDVLGAYHFNGNFNNANDLKKALDELKTTSYAALAEKERDLVLQIFEAVFNHKAFTGRSGTFFSYEGLGSIYWHMVSKLHLAVQEVCLNAAASGEPAAVIQRVHTHFDEIGEGIGVHKSPEQYGAFPTDPYSHTPQHRGAQQPGMTGQVKEDILVRFAELGVSVQEGKLTFNPVLLRKEEFLTESQSVETIGISQQTRRFQLPSGSLCFTCCQVPVIYTIAEEDAVEVTFRDGTTNRENRLQLDESTSRQVFARTGTIASIAVSLRSAHLR